MDNDINDPRLKTSEHALNVCLHAVELNIRELIEKVAERHF
jgi:hypothetical protein